MGLDVALGVVILIAAIRGWLQGFTYQVIRIGGLIACVYLAAPVRDQAKPHVVEYLPTMPANLVDRLLWWVAAVLSYVVVVGGATVATKMTRRPEVPGMPPPRRSRNDQFAGFLVGIAKGALVAVFLAAAIDTYGLKQMETIPWAQKQVKTSLALRWDRQYHPASKVWQSVPVQHYVHQIHRMGLQDPSPSKADAPEEDGPAVQTARKGPTEGKSAVKGDPPAPQTALEADAKPE